MLSTVVPVVILVITILACEELAGMYGVGIAAVGMLSTLGITLATDAFRPVADNLGGKSNLHKRENIGTIQSSHFFPTANFRDL